MLKRISLLVFALAFASCASHPTHLASPSVPTERTLASNGCSPEPCVYIQDFNGSQATFVGQGFESTRQRSFQINVYADGQFLEDINTNPNGSFSYTTPAGRARPGTHLEVKVLNWNGNGQHWTGSAVIADTPPPAPPPYQMSEEALAAYADQQARTVANRVTRTYGELEKWKYNFTMGYWQGAHYYEISTAADADFDSGVNHGRRNGEDLGYRAGESEGNSIGSSAGQASAQARFRAVVNTENAPDTNIGEFIVPPFGGLSAPGSLCDSLGSKTSELEGQLSNEMRDLRFGDSDIGYLDYDPALYSITFKEINGWGNGKYEFVDSYFRSTYAWDEWMRNDLGGKYDKNNYRKLDGNQAAQFRNIFTQVYDRTIDEKFTRKKEEFNPTANARGQWYGVEIGKRQRFDAGCAQGYNERYVPASIRGFRTAYPGGFRSGFKSTSSYYSTHAVVSLDGIRLVEGNENGVFELGEEIGIEIGRYTNLGRVAATNLPITLTGKGIKSRRSDERITLAPSSSKVVNRRVMGLANIREDVIADQAYDIAATVGGQTQPLSFTVSWASAIQALATVPPESSASLKNFVMKNIQEEYRVTEDAKENIYAEGKTSKMLELVQFYERLPENRRAVVRSMGPAILAWQAEFKHAHNKWSTGKIRKNFTELVQRLR